MDTLHDPEPVLDPTRLPLRERDQASLFLQRPVFELLEQHLDDVADLRRGFGLIPFVPRDMAFALVAHVNEHELAIDAENLPFQHGVDRKRGGTDRVFTLGGAGHGEFEFLIEFVSEFQFANEVAVDHAWGFREKTGLGEGK